MDKEDSSPGGEWQSENASTEAAYLLKQELERSTNGSSKRSASGGLLSRIPFLRPSSDLRLLDESRNDGLGASPNSSQHNTPGDRKARSRRGSLRKAALLSLGKTKLEKEKKPQAVDLNELETTSNNNHLHSTTDDSSMPPSPDSDDYPTPRASIDDHSTPQGFKIEHQESTTSEESLPLLKFTRQPRHPDTTTEQDVFRRDSQKLQVPIHTTSPAGPRKNDYHVLDNSLLRRRASRARSPLSAVPIEPLPIPEEWDYSETEWWGWAILMVTWIVFVMGMGSCFEVWSWAWAVGKTPYAPPELEDDPTLPIVGYYPALIILTGVMAWIWVFTAWVGMKYFRHAKIS